MIDAVNRIFSEGSEQHSVQLLRRWQIMPEGLLQNDTGAFGTTGFGQLRHHGRKYRRRNRHVKRRPLSIIKHLAQGLKRRQVGNIASHIAQQATEPFKSSGIKFAALLQAASGAGL